MNSDRDIEAEIEREIRRQIPAEDWKPWGPINSSEEYGDFEFYADRLKKKGKLGSLDVLASARTNLFQFAEEIKVNKHPTEYSDYEVELFVNWLDNEKNLDGSTIDNYVSVLKGMADFYVMSGYYNGNPFTDIDKKSDEKPSTSLINHKRSELKISTLRQCVNESGVKRPATVIIATLAKTGMRISELCNLDQRDIHIDHPIWKKVCSSPRPELENKPDTIWIDAGKERTDVIPETHGNKRKVDTPIPIDKELKRLLIWYVITAPVNYETPTPLFRSNKSSVGTRLSSSQAARRVVGWAKENDLHEYQREEMKNVTPHRFRSLFSTVMYKRLESDDIGGFEVQKFVKGLRGDVGQDVLDEYIGLFGEYREPVTDSMAKLNIN